MRARNGLIWRLSIVATAAASVATFVAACADVRHAVQESAPPPAIGPPVRISIVLGGDVMQHMPQIEAARQGTTYDYTETFRHLVPFLDSADLTVFNLETPLTRGGYSGYPLFSAPSQLADAMCGCGVDAVTLANNHILDKGRAGVLSTLSSLDNAGLRHTGVFADSAGYHRNNPLIFGIKGVRVALLNYTYGTNGMPATGGTVVNLIDTARIAADLTRAARFSPDVTIIYYHWGYEYHGTPNRAQIELSEWSHRHGADFVVGSHPHVIQPLEIRHDGTGRPRGLTAYSLGNLVSNQRGRHRNGGILLRLDIVFRDSLRPEFEASYLPVWVHTPVEGGRRRYIVLPSPVADTMPLEDHAKDAYDTFISDTRKLFGDTPVREITASTSAPADMPTTASYFSFSFASITGRPPR